MSIRRTEWLPRRDRRTVATWLAAAGLVAWEPSAVAQTEARGVEPRVLLVDPASPDVLSRIEGQTADLAWDVRLDPSPLPAGDAAAPEALGRGGRADADAVVWLEPLGAGWTVHVLEVGPRRWMSRPVPAGSGRYAASAAAEGAALVVRTSLEALGRGDPLDDAVGVTAPPEVVADPAPDGPRSPDPPSPPASAATGADSHEAPRAEDGDRPHLGVDGLLAWQLVFDGLVEPVVHGPVFGLGLTLGPWAVDVVASTGPAGSAEVGGVSLALRRSTVDLGVRYAVLDTAPWRLEVAVRGGGVLYFRSTVAAGEDTPEPDSRTLAWHGAAEVHARVALAGWVELALFAGLDVISRIAFPVCGTDTSGNPCAVGDHPSAEPWQAQPRVGLGLAGHWRGR